MSQVHAKGLEHMSAKSLWAIVLVVMGSAFPTLHAAEPPLAAVEQLTAKVKTGNATARAEAVASMLAMLQNDPERAIPAARGKWASVLSGARQPASVAQVMTAAIEAAGKQVGTGQVAEADPSLFADLWSKKITALVDAKQPKEAVAALRQAMELRLGGNGGASLGPRLTAYQYVIKAAVEAHLDSDVLDIATAAIPHRANQIIEIGQFQRARAEALLKTGKYDAALSAAKGYYNVCRLAETADAIDLLAACLVNARPDDAGVVRCLKSQQIAMATPLDSAATQPAAPALQNAVELNVLGTIPSEGKLYDDAIAAITRMDYDTLMAKGNLLLLADRGDQAGQCFQTAADLAKDDKQLATAIEGVARAIRTAEQGVGGANAYIISLQENETK